MAKRQQQQVFEALNRPKDVFGGSLLKSHPKTKRPLDSKFATHLVLRANQSVMRRPGTLHLVNEQVRRSCKRHGVRLYEYANVGNHLHLLIKLRNRRSWNAFIREVTGRIAQLTRGTLRGAPRTALRTTAPAKLRTEASTTSAGFWKHRPYTRIVRGWKRAYQLAKEYVKLNVLEAEGMINRRETKTLKDLRLIWKES